MELKKYHRQALLAELETAQNDRESLERCLDKEIQTMQKAMEEKSSQLEAISATVQGFEVMCFLRKERVNLIKKSLIDNEIDY